jgi:hypothetical protein
MTSGSQSSISTLKFMQRAQVQMLPSQRLWATV